MSVIINVQIKVHIAMQIYVYTLICSYLRLIIIAMYVIMPGSNIATYIETL